jgi:hypothetical protein
MNGKDLKVDSNEIEEILSIKKRKQIASVFNIFK